MTRKYVRKKTAVAEPVKKRRASVNRGPRTYYAMDKEGTRLFRFARHAHRLAAMRADKLKPLGALAFRELLASDIEGKLKVIDTRSKAGEQYLAPLIEQAQSVPLDTERLTTAIVKALAPLIASNALNQDQARTNNRLTADH